MSTIPSRRIVSTASLSGTPTKLSHRLRKSKHPLIVNAQRYYLKETDERLFFSSSKTKMLRR